MKYPIAIVVYLFFIGFTCHVFAQGKLTQSIDSLIHLKVPRSFNGVIVISKAGKSIYKRSYGYNDIVKKIPLQIDNQFLVASISKQFTATIVLREVQAGHIHVEHTIRSYLPNFNQSWADSVTIQQLLNHTSGIVNWDKSLAFKPRTKFSYSNINYAILGKIIEKTSEQTYAALTENLFKVCKMGRSTVPPSPGIKSDVRSLVKGYSENGNENYQEANILALLDSPPMGVPAAGMISTAEDLTKWMYSLHTGKLLTDNTYKMMITNSVMRPHRWGEVKYGDGIQIDTLDNTEELSMSGYVPGFISTMIYYPKTKVSLVVLENRSPDPSNMNRVYFFHDQIRQLVKAHLVNSKPEKI